MMMMMMLMIMIMMMMMMKDADNADENDDDEDDSIGIGICNCEGDLTYSIRDRSQSCCSRVLACHGCSNSLVRISALEEILQRDCELV